jgi:hypothetical protein
MSTLDCRFLANTSELEVLLVSERVRKFLRRENSYLESNHKYSLVRPLPTETSQLPISKEIRLLGFHISWMEKSVGCLTGSLKICRTISNFADVFAGEMKC